jgi:hypothetical protein
MPARVSHNLVARERKNAGERGRVCGDYIMSAQIDRRRFGFDPIEWLMLLTSIAVLALVALAI